MGDDYPDWHPLSTIAQYRDQCECPVKKRTIGVGTVAGATAYICQDCGGYVE